MSLIKGTHGQSHLGKAKRISVMDGSTALYSHNSESHREKVRTQPTQEMVIPYAQPCLLANRLANHS